jgi:uncharacterized membrane protein YobD (UPF0266 family)
MYLYLSASFVIEVCSQITHFLASAFILKHMWLAFLKNASIFACHKSFHISNNFLSVITIHLENLMASSSGLEISYHSRKLVNKIFLWLDKCGPHLHTIFS